MNDVARSAILGDRAPHPPEMLPPALKCMGASFVTLAQVGKPARLLRLGDGETAARRRHQG